MCRGAYHKNRGNRSSIQATGGQWEFYSRAHAYELEAAEDLVKQLFELANQSEDKTLLLEAHHSGWATTYARGNAAAMVDYAKKRLAIYHSGAFPEHIRVYGHDPGVCAYANGAAGLWLLDYPDQARQHVHKGLELVKKLNHPLSTSVIKWGTTMISFFCGENEAALIKANELAALTEEHGFPSFARIAILLQEIANVQVMSGSERMTQIRKVY